MEESAILVVSSQVKFNSSSLLLTADRLREELFWQRGAKVIILGWHLLIKSSSSPPCPLVRIWLETAPAGVPQTYRAPEAPSLPPPYLSLSRQHSTASTTALIQSICDFPTPGTYIYSLGPHHIPPPPLKALARTWTMFPRSETVSDQGGTRSRIC